MIGIITWKEDTNGNGQYVLRWDDGRLETEPCEDPIDASTDSHDVAGLFGKFASVEHDGQYIYVADSR